jgi:hypothetical protein
MLCHVEVHDVTPTMGEHKEHEEDSESDSRDDEKID